MRKSKKEGGRNRIGKIRISRKELGTKITKEVGNKEKKKSKRE